MDLGFGLVVSVCYSVIPMKSVVETIVSFKCDPEGIPKSDKSRFQTVISVFGGTLVRAVPPPCRSWVPTGTGGQDVRQKDFEKDSKES